MTRTEIHAALADAADRNIVEITFADGTQDHGIPVDVDEDEATLEDADGGEFHVAYALVSEVEVIDA